MYKKIVKYTDFNGIAREEEILFFLSKTDITKMNVRYEGGLQEKFQKIMNKLNVKELIAVVEDIILSAYGEKSDDGTKFIKNEKLKEGFACSIAYDEIFQDLISDPDKLADFIKKILPQDIQERINEEQAKGNSKLPNIVAESQIKEVKPVQE